MWDGEPSRGIGGTSGLIDIARDTGRPILYMSATAPHLLSFGEETDAMVCLNELTQATLATSAQARH